VNNIVTLVLAGFAYSNGISNL